MFSFQLPLINLPPNNISLTIPTNQKLKEEDPSQVRFLGPIPPPVTLPPKWKYAKDKYGRPYYYHIKIRKSQWEPPLHPEISVADEAECKLNSIVFIHIFKDMYWH